MDWFKFFGGGMLAFLIPGMLIQFGNELKKKDLNTTGWDDAEGNILIAIAPVIPALASGDGTLIKRTILAAYNALGNYIGFEPREMPAEPTPLNFTPAAPI
jgi:hypothetical protein